MVVQVKSAACGGAHGKLRCEQMADDSEVERPGAFWSYVRKDDKAEGGRIVHLAQLLSQRIELLTGEDSFRIFVDNTSIHWGHHFEKKLEEAIVDTTMFICVITPRYFKSRACRDELRLFASTAKRLGLR